MNIIRGIDRIALVLGIVPFLLGFYLGVHIVHEDFKTVTSKYKVWEKKYYDRIDQLQQEVKKRSPDADRIKDPVYELRSLLMQEENDPILQNIIKRKPPKYQDRPPWQRIIGGLIIASLSFLVVLFAIRGMTRGVKWIIDGFRDGKLTNNP